MQTIDTIHVFGSADERTLEQARDVRSRAVHMALMADNHLGYIMPIGGVAAYREQVSVAGVGFDIACGVIAIRTDRQWSELAGQANELADTIASSVSFGLGRTRQASDSGLDNHELFSVSAWDAIPHTHREGLREKARAQLGTVGSGNHYVNLMEDENGRVVVACHFGSRGLGHTIAANFMALASGERWGTRVAETEALLDVDVELGQRYWALMQLAGGYASVGRVWVANTVAGLVGGEILDVVHNHHNYAWREVHDIGAGPESLIVVRKGATPAFPGQRGFVGGSMGDAAYIVEGARHESSDPPPLMRASLYSTIHGAGRVMSRSQARGSRPKYNKETGERSQRRKGAITRQMMSDWTREKGVVVRGGDVDESPHVYRRLDEVIPQQEGTITVLSRLEPRIVVMAGAGVKDPFRD